MKELLDGSVFSWFIKLVAPNISVGTGTNGKTFRTNKMRIVKMLGIFAGLLLVTVFLMNKFAPTLWAKVSQPAPPAP